MVGEARRSLKVFLCHASGDKPPVREFYKRLVSEGVDAWLDKEKLLPGQDWRVEIPRAVQEADVVIVFLSKNSVTKEGYVQREIKFALDIAEEKPEGTIFLIPARIEECSVPERLGRWQWVDLYEEGGYAKLLRSLKLRADKVGAVIESASYVDTDKERERRLDQLYTEGLAAFWVDDWERACQRFRSILNEQPNHAGATEKLAEAERQRDLTRLYTRSLEAIGSENWQVAIRTLEELCQKSPDYKDVAQLLRNARRQKQLKELYSEARTLHAAQKWQAVVRVFEQVHSIEPTYPDPENLLETARKEVEELNRLAELNDLYRHAVREMDAGQWATARDLLEKIHKSQIGFQETERLLRKAENEIEKIEERQRQTHQINGLYEQAHGLMQSHQWQKALTKLEEIHALDDQFPDAEDIANRAKAELAREEEETQRQQHLSLIYSKAVGLLKQAKYQAALEKWNEVQAIDPTYKDTARVRFIAKRELDRLARPVVSKQPQISLEKIRTEWFILLGALGFGFARLVEQNLAPLLHVGIPAELAWALRGMIGGLVTVWVLQKAIQEWKWKAVLSFVICWAVLYPLVLVVIMNRGTLLLVSLVFSLAPILSIIVSSKLTGPRLEWKTGMLIFIGWILAWLIGQSSAGYLPESFFRWAIGDAIAGGVGLWITLDLLKVRSESQSIEAELALDLKTMHRPERVLLLAFLGTIIIRAIWGVLQSWLHIWHGPSPSLLQFSFLFVLGGCYGAVVAVVLKRVVSGWGWKHSTIVIAGWAFGLSTAILTGRVNLPFIMAVIVLCGLSVTAAIKWASPSLSPLKVTLIFMSWALVWKYGNMLGGFLQVNLSTDYAWCIVDAVTVLLGLLATLGIHECSSSRLLRTTLITAIGFAAGNYLATASIGLLSVDPQIGAPLGLALWGFLGGAVFEIPSRELKKIFIRGGLCGTGLLLGYFSALLLFPHYVSSGSLRNILWGIWLGIAFGLSIRRFSGIALVTIISSAIFTITAVYVSNIYVSIISAASLWDAIIRGAWIGLVLGFGYAYATGNLEDNKLAS